MASTADLLRKLQAMRQKTAEMRSAAESARAKADSAKANYHAYVESHVPHSAAIELLKSKIASVNSDTARIENGLRRQDRIADRSGAAGVGPRGGRFIIVNGKKRYLK